MYNISKTCDKSFRPMHRISSEEKINNFDKNVSYFQNLKSKDSPEDLTEFEPIRTVVKKKISDDRNRMSLLQDKIVSSSVENVQIIKGFNSKERYSVRDHRGAQERSKNSSIQKGTKPSFMKKVDSSSLASKAEMKPVLPGQSNFKVGTTISLGEIPSAKESFVDNSSSPSSKKRKYKVKVKVRRKKKRKNSPPPPPPPPPPRLSPLPSKSTPPPPPLSRLQRSSQPQAGFLSLLSDPRSILPPTPVKPPIPSLSFPPHPIPDYPHGNSIPGNVTFTTYPREMLSMIPYYQLQQAVQTPQCTVGGLSNLQVTGHTFPCAVHNSYPFFTVPQALPLYPNYPPTLNTQMHICQQLPVMPYTNPQPKYPNWNAGNFKS